MTGTGAYANRSIFLPAAGSGYGSDFGEPGSDGYYWSSTPLSDTSNYAWGLDFYSGDFYGSNGGRCGGQSVRPVQGLTE